MNTPQRSDEPLVDLLIKEATEGLSSEERAELAKLTYRFPSMDTHFAEDTVAALTLALVGKGERIPGGLRDSILGEADFPHTGSKPVSLDDARFRRDRKGLTTAAVSSTAGWWTAAAAFVLAVAGWWPRLATDSAQMANQSPVETRQELLASGHAIRASWTPAVAAPGEGEPLVGDVVFDPVSQRGFLTFRGIPANDPRLAQYQL